MVYCIDPSADEPIFLINKHIGYDKEDGMGIDGSIFQQELLQVDSLGKKRIQVWINSPGGVVTDGYSIYTAILKSKTPVDTYVTGAAASIAGVIFQAGRKRIMTDYSWLMYHNPFGGDNAKMLATMQQSIVTMIEQRSGMTEDQISAMMKRTTFIGADEALQMKLCDKVDASEDENTKYLRKITDSLEFHRECNMVLNTIINPITKSTTMFPKVTMRLKLNDAATEDNVVKAIDEIENRAKQAETMALEAITEAQNKAKADADEIDKLRAKLKKLEDDKVRSDAEYEDCKNKLGALEKDKKTAEDKAQEDKAKNMIDDFAKIGRIKNEETIKLTWIKLAKADFEGTKNMIEALPMNKEAVKITDATPNVLKNGEIGTTAVGLSVMNRLKREGKL